MRGIVAFCFAMVIGSVAQAQDGNPAEPTVAAAAGRNGACVFSSPEVATSVCVLIAPR